MCQSPPSPLTWALCMLLATADEGGADANLQHDQNNDCPRTLEESICLADQCAAREAGGTMVCCLVLV